MLTARETWQVVLDCQLRNALRWCYHSKIMIPAGTLFSIYIPESETLMTAPLTLLIVEDETPLAEMHAEYIRHIPGFSQILLAETRYRPE